MDLLVLYFKVGSDTSKIFSDFGGRSEKTIKVNKIFKSKGLYREIVWGRGVCEQ
jgi:hypothetical protein